MWLHKIMHEDHMLWLHSVYIPVLLFVCACVYMQICYKCYCVVYHVIILVSLKSVVDM